MERKKLSGKEVRYILLQNRVTSFGNFRNGVFVGQPDAAIAKIMTAIKASLSVTDEDANST